MQVVRIKKRVADALNRLQLLRWRAYEITNMDEYKYPVIFPIEVILGDKKIHSDPGETSWRTLYKSCGTSEIGSLDS